ncbi:response regulator [Alteromonas sp. C1M14]|uniref:response regulator n=1 Tax=Alteromonas sp. C1M14 TaxID=2841567 RepID=UPI001C0A298F|nr:response regulator [Alteromonas sp. C1M14]MBU2976932.1 response regulator [Alteromonas sp. C1M14]
MDYADKRVLIVEDQRPFLLVLRGLLHDMGATEVVTKPSAEQALSLCRKRKFDIIISDLHLGSDKKNGFEFIEELRGKKLLKATSIFMLISADSTRPIVLGSIDRSPDDYLIKPFSQAQIKARLNRAWNKRQQLLPVFQALHDENEQRAQQQAEALFTANTHYRGTLAQILIEIYWKNKQYAKVNELLAQFDKDRHVLWIRIYQAKNLLKMVKLDEAKAMAESVLVKNRFSAEAHDILAECQHLANEGEPALKTIRQAIKISPYCVHRHVTACKIARKYKDFVLASESAQAIWQLSRKTLQQHANIWCEYIRSILDVAEHAEDKRTKNRYQQEALLAMQRGKFDEYLCRNNDNFDFLIYEQIINARVYSLDGKLADAKRSIVSSQDAIEQKYDAYPVFYAPDSIKVFFDLGEYDEADTLLRLVNDNHYAIENTLIQTDKLNASENQRQYMLHNKEGIEHYQAGDFDAAYLSFGQALHFAPVNTGVALNLLQCILKLISKNTTREPGLLNECRRLNALLGGMPMKTHYQQKFDDLKKEIKGFIGKAA